MTFFHVVSCDFGVLLAHCWSRDHQYRAQNVGSESSDDARTYVNVTLPVRIGAFRAKRRAHNGFVLETMIDEAAHATGPLAYRFY